MYVLSRTGRRVACVVLALTLALGLAACGGGGPREPTAEERSAIEANYEDYVKGFTEGDPEAICESLAPSYIADIGEEACVEQYEPVVKEKAFVKGIESSEIERIEVADDDSIARMYFVGVDTFVRFLPEEGSWYVFPAPLEPAT